MTSQSIADDVYNCDARTRKAIPSSFDIDFVHGHIRDRSSKKYIHAQNCKICSIYKFENSLKSLVILENNVEVIFQHMSPLYI